MARVLRVEGASEVHDGPQPDTAPERAPVPGPHPVEDSAGPHHDVSLRGGEAHEVAQHAFLVDQLEAGRTTASEVDIDGGA